MKSYAFTLRLFLISWPCLSMESEFSSFNWTSLLGRGPSSLLSSLLASPSFAATTATALLLLQLHPHSCPPNLSSFPFCWKKTDEDAVQIRSRTVCQQALSRESNALLERHSNHILLISDEVCLSYGSIIRHEVMTAMVEPRCSGHTGRRNRILRRRPRLSMLSSAAVTCQIGSRDAAIAVTKSFERVQLRMGSTECPAEPSARWLLAPFHTDRPFLFFTAPRQEVLKTGARMDCGHGLRLGLEDPPQFSCGAFAVDLQRLWGNRAGFRQIACGGQLCNS